jgi:hypothetical protein
MPPKSNRWYAQKGPVGQFRKKRAAAKTIQAAYRNRRQFRKNIQPFTETKKLAGEPTPALRTALVLKLANTHAFNIITPVEYLYRKQGTAEGEMVGDNVYGRFLTMKLQIGFPQGINNIIWPTSLHVYWITVFQELNLTAFTTPTRSGSAGGAVTKTQIEEHISNQLKEFYNSKSDQMQFHDVVQGIRVDKHQVVRPNRNMAIGQPTTGQFQIGSAPNLVGGPPDIFLSHTWNIKQKMHYQDFDNNNGGNDTHYLNKPGRAGYKCCVIYNPDYQKQVPAQVPGSDPVEMTDPTIEYQHNACFWYGDS